MKISVLVRQLMVFLFVAVLIFINGCTKVENRSETHSIKWGGTDPQAERAEKSAKGAETRNHVPPADVLNGYNGPHRQQILDLAYEACHTPGFWTAYRLRLKASKRALGSKNLTRDVSYACKNYLRASDKTVKFDYRIEKRYGEIPNFDEVKDSSKSRSVKFAFCYSGASIYFQTVPIDLGCTDYPLITLPEETITRRDLPASISPDVLNDPNLIHYPDGSKLSKTARIVGRYLDRTTVKLTTSYRDVNGQQISEKLIPARPVEVALRRRIGIPVRSRSVSGVSMMAEPSPTTSITFSRHHGGRGHRCGDVNGDGHVSIEDAKLIVSCDTDSDDDCDSSDLSKGYSLQVCDVDGDDDCDHRDADLIVRKKVRGYSCRGVDLVKTKAFESEFDSNGDRKINPGETVVIHTKHINVDKLRSFTRVEVKVGPAILDGFDYGQYINSSQSNFKMTFTPTETFKHNKFFSFSENEFYFKLKTDTPQLQLPKHLFYVVEATYFIGATEIGTSRRLRKFHVKTRRGANRDTYLAREGFTLEITNPAEGVLANDVGGSNALQVVKIVEKPLHGTVNMLSDGTFTYVPEKLHRVDRVPEDLWSGIDTFVYRIKPSDDDSSSSDSSSADETKGDQALVTIVVESYNSRPLAGNDFYTMDQGTTLSGNVGENDFDPDSTLLTYALGSGFGPELGEVLLNPDGSFTYEPDPASSGEDTFTYIVSDNGDGKDDTASKGVYAEVTITINPITQNLPPTADSVLLFVDEDTILTGNLNSYSNDPEGFRLTFNLLGSVQHGTLTLDSFSGAFSYRPNQDVSGIQDSFTFSVTDQRSLPLLVSPPATVTIDIIPVNDPPIARDDNYNLIQGNGFLAVPAPHVLENDSDVEPGTLTLSPTFTHIGIANSFLYLNEITNDLEYTLFDENFTGVDYWKYTVLDEEGEGATAIVSFTTRSLDRVTVEITPILSNGFIQFLVEFQNLSPTDFILFLEAEIVVSSPIVTGGNILDSFSSTIFPNDFEPLTTFDRAELFGLFLTYDPAITNATVPYELHVRVFIDQWYTQIVKPADIIIGNGGTSLP